MPTKEKLYREFGRKGLTILAVSFGETVEQVEDFQTEFKLSFPVLYDPEDSISKNYRVQGHPVTFIIDREGSLLGKVIGERDWSSTEARALITDLLNTNN